MKRIPVLLFAFLTIVLGTAFWGTTTQQTSGFDHRVHQANQTLNPKVDGAVNPEAIPDYAAYEIVFRLLSSESKNEQQGIRKRAYTALSGFSDAEGAALSNAAYEYKRNIEALDAEVLAIKDATWPDPTREVMDKLTKLQRQKELIIEGVATRLQTQLANYDTAKLSRFIGESVKRKTKAFGTALPVKRTGRIGQRISSLFSASAATQAPGCDSSVYVYSSTNVDMNNAVVYGYGSYSEGYNNCGHTYTPSTDLSGPGGAYSIDGVLYLQETPGIFIDGFFSSTTDVEGYCSIANSSYPAGNNSSSTELVPYFILGMFDTGFSQSTVHVGGNDSATIHITVNASQGMTSTRHVDCVLGASSVSGNAGFDGNMGSQTINMLTGGGSVQITATYNPNSLVGGSATYNATALLNNPSADTGILPPPNRTSAAYFTVIP